MHFLHKHGRAPQNPYSLREEKLRQLRLERCMRRVSKEMNKKLVKYPVAELNCSLVLKTKEIINTMHLRNDIV